MLKDVAATDEGVGGEPSKHARENKINTVWQSGPVSVMLRAGDLLGSLMLVVLLAWVPTSMGIFLVALVWKSEINIALHVFMITLLFLLMVVLGCSACCRYCRCCCGQRKCCCRRGAAEEELIELEVRRPKLRAVCTWFRRQLPFMMAGLLLGCVGFGVGFGLLFHMDIGPPSLREDYEAQRPVAVVGGGASGLSAAWLLAQGGRNVTIFESNDELGGHSMSWVDTSGGRNLTVDLGFIFNNGGYGSYKAIVRHFNLSLRTTSLNTSGFFDGEYWDNTAVGRRFDAELEQEMDRFMNFVNEPVTILRYLTPFGIWLWYNGFTTRFRRLTMDSTMSVLFVTKMGLWKQSAQAVLNHFSMSGFTHLRFDVPRVQFNPEGSQNMWRKLVVDMLGTGRVSIRTRTSVEAVEPEDGAWAISLGDGSKLGGFSDVVLAIPADVAMRIVRGRFLQRTVVSQVGYVEAHVTLHTDWNATIYPNFRQASDRVLYFVTDQHMTGTIGRIFEDMGSNLLLTVHGQGQDLLDLDPAKTKWRTTWSHHYFTLWELAISQRIVPLFNGDGGLHYAGDWIYGVGHNDAIKAGTRAACAVGVPRRLAGGPAAQLYADLLGMCA